MNTLIGELLRPPALRFNYSSASANAFDARKGLQIYGPYDSNILGKNSISAAVIYPLQYEKEREMLINGLTKGQNSFVGFERLFRIPLIVSEQRSLSKEDEAEMRRVAQNLASQGNLDIVLLLVASQDSPAYRVAKQELLGNGIPNQVITVEKLRDSRQAPWVLENVALACYAKAGGTPWVVASDSSQRELIIGISRAQDPNRQFVVGFVTLFTQNGDFLLLNSIAPVLEWKQEKYVNGLSELIVDAYHEYCQIHGEPQAIILHLCKRPGRFREVEAAQQALQQIGSAIPYAFMHLNDDSSYRLFDTTHITYIPQAGLKVELGRRNALLLLDGLINDKRSRRGVPRVLDISMDKRSTMPADEFPRMVHQIYNLSRVNWRGFNSRGNPVTLNYSSLIARLILDIGADTWNQIISKGRLRDKAWFL